MSDEAKPETWWDKIYNKDGTRKVKLTPEQVVEERRLSVIRNEHEPDQKYTCDSRP